MILKSSLYIYYYIIYFYEFIILNNDLFNYYLLIRLYNLTILNENKQTTLLY